MKTELLSFLYLYGVGGGLFVASLVLLVKRKALDLGSADGRRWLVLLVVGYAAYGAFHVATQFVLPYWGAVH